MFLLAFTPGMALWNLTFTQVTTVKYVGEGDYLTALESKNKQADSREELKFRTWKQGLMRSGFPI